MNTVEQTRYETQNLNLAAFLISSGACHLKGIEGHNSWKKTFLLAPAPASSLIDSFFNGEGKVSAMEYANQLRILKSAALSGGSNV